MKLVEVLERLRKLPLPPNSPCPLLLTYPTVAAIYECIVANNLQTCIELGTGYGGTTCVMAAAVDELDHGRVITIDRMVQQPINVGLCKQGTGLGARIEDIVDPLGYNWTLAKMIEEHTVDGVCQPFIDFCLLDGAHQWEPDALAVALVSKLLKPGAWLVLDDLDFRLRNCQVGWEKLFGHMSDRELDSAQVGMVFELVVRQSADFDSFNLTEGGRIGWARKVGGEQTVSPGETKRQSVKPSEVFRVADLATQSQLSAGLSYARNENHFQLLPVDSDPYIILPDKMTKGQLVNSVTIRCRGENLTNKCLKAYWTNAMDEHFTEFKSVAATFNDTDDWQDATIVFPSGPSWPQMVRLRIDPIDAPVPLIMDSLTLNF